MNIANIETLARYLVDADTTSFPAANLLIFENNAYEDIVAKILGCDGRWDFDDTNYTSFPTATATLVASQQDYSFDVSFLKLIGVSVKDANGLWRKLIPFDPDDLQTFGSMFDRAEFLKTAGSPFYYDLLGNSVLLYPAPDNGVSVTLSAGLKVYFQRTASIFTSAEVSTGTKVPGFASPFHQLISYKAALPYAQNYKPARVPMIMAEIARMEKELIAFYSKRDRDERPTMTMRPVNHR